MANVRGHFRDGKWVSSYNRLDRPRKSLFDFNPPDENENPKKTPAGCMALVSLVAFYIIYKLTCN